MDRDRIVEELRSREDDWGDLLWEAVTLFQGYTFTTSGRRRGDKITPGIDFTYRIKISSRTGKPTDELIISRKETGKTITRSTVERGFENARAIQRAEGFVKGPKRLNVFGASYLYAIFLEWGIITSGEWT